MRIFLTGGGTAGSVTPLLAVAEHLTEHELHFIGTYTGVERKLVPATIAYHAIQSGKLRRYWSLKNLLDPFFIILGFKQALWLMLRYKPSVVVSAGSFVAVPVVWAAWCCGVKVVVHQQDLRVGLATRLTAPFADVLTKAFAKCKLRGARVIGNPVRNLQVTTDDFKLDQQFPTVLVFGGGTGAQGLNNLVTTQWCEQSNVIHVTGVGKNVSNPIQHPRYHGIELLTAAMPEALHKADVVVGRAGLGTISELAVLGKAAIIVPMPNSHQADNANLLRDHQAAIVLEQELLTPEKLYQQVKQLLLNPDQRAQLQQHISALNPATAATTLAQLVATKV